VSNRAAVLTLCCTVTVSDKLSDDHVLLDTSSLSDALKASRWARSELGSSLLF
jgi:hypothetical protein